MIRNCTRVVSDVLPSISKSTKSNIPSYNIQQIRSTVIVKRKFPPRLAKIGYVPKIRPRNTIYEFVERVHSKPRPDIECILTQNVYGVGVEGELVKVSRKLFRNELYPSKKAVYASPENLADYETFRDEMGKAGKPKITKFTLMTINQLQKLYLPIPMSGDTEWTLNKEHIRLALRKVGVEAAEHTITFTDTSITEPKEFQFQISVMGTDPITIDAYIHLVYKDPAKNIDTQLPPVWQAKPKPAAEEESAEQETLEESSSDSSDSDSSDSDSSDSDSDKDNKSKVNVSDLLKDVFKDSDVKGPDSKIPEKDKGPDSSDKK